MGLSPLKQPDFLPTSRAEMERLGWEELDILLIEGDAYLDHPAQGPALLGRWLVEHGFRVGLIAQPRWRDTSDFLVLGRPRLFAALSAGSMDSMLAHYTAFRKKRSEDALTPSGRAGARPNRATLVYASLVKAAFPTLPVIIGGLEASLRRLSHYDFWQDKLRRSFLLEAKADLLVYGAGERPLLEIARRLNQNPKESLWGLAGTAAMGRPPEGWAGDFMELPSHEQIEAEPGLLLKATLAAEAAVHNGGPALVQASAGRVVTVFAPPAALTTEEMDRLYALPFSRRAHPGYRQTVPAAELLRSSVTSHRGCGGGCSFCSLALHQGRRVSARSAASLRRELEELVRSGIRSVSDVGGPTANMWASRCQRPEGCHRRSCLWPKLCRHLRPGQSAWVEMLELLAATPGLRRLRVASGLRYDLALAEPEVLKIFLERFIGGQLKVAPEQLDDELLSLMRKPPLELWEKFLSFFERWAPRGRYLVPYLISAFPGCSEEQMRAVSAWLARRRWKPRQVQAFIPTPGTVATAMYYAGLDEVGRPLAVARSDAERLRQHAYIVAGRP